MTQDQVKEIFKKAPIREFGNQKLKGYFLIELKRLGLRKVQLRKLIEKEILVEGWYRIDKVRQLMRFYFVKE